MVAVYDDVAEYYDASRGGERRGDDFARELDARLPPGQGPVLEVGVGTGVISLGLVRRGRTVLGIDVAEAMLARAQGRLGPVLIRGDGRQLPFADNSIPHAVSVWVVHAVIPAEALFADVARVLEPGGRYLVCPTNRLASGDPIQPICEAMFERAHRLHSTWRRNPITITDLLAWGTEAGFKGHVETFQSRTWETTADELRASIRDRVWPALQGLGDAEYREVTMPAIEATQSLPPGPISQHAEVDVAVLSFPVQRP